MLDASLAGLVACVSANRANRANKVRSSVLLRCIEFWFLCGYLCMFSVV